MHRLSRVMKQHAWSRKPHDFFDFFLHVGAIAVNKAFAAGAFLLLEGTFVKPHVSIGKEVITFSAEFVAFGSMVCSAVYVNHVFDGSFFSGYSRMLRVCLCR